ncbi:tudor domain-containing protein 15 [Python bivittatus]|uniref:Tudor domain-containing protein 15 n=1 Tax=Python bivittatus TaxID=176946 RepID=A0A9F5N2M6_PYTBI|nr:tudor domain-containing protein 15 [Python bivittatus]
MSEGGSERSSALVVKNRDRGGMDSSSSRKFLDVDVKITNIYYDPKDVLVKFQGQYNTDCEFDYHILQREIQQVPKVRDPVAVGEFCLAEDSDCGEWYRGRVIQKSHDIYEVFFVDNGKILTVHETHLASPIDELFQLPPKIVCGIFANVLPIEEKWTAKAFNYFLSLIGLQIKGHIQAVLPHQTFLLEVPKIANDMVEFRLGKLVDVDTFHLIVEMLTEFPHESHCKQMPDLLQQKYTRPGSLFCGAGIQPDIQPILSKLQPILSIGAVEKVKISVAVSPSKFYCQLLRQQVQLDKFTTDMSSYYETISKVKLPSRDNLGVLCAARRKNGQWQRGVIQQLLFDNKVKIWFMDFGNYEAVPSECILKLQPEFISVPMFSFPCALSCLSDQDGTVRHAQLEEFKEALLTQQVISAHIDLFNGNEHLYYVTLRKCAFTLTSEYLSWENDVVPKHYPLYNTEVSCTDGNVQNSSVNSVLAENVYNTAQQSSHSFNQKDTHLLCSPLTIPCKRAEMKIDSVCVAFAVYVLNPSNFWVQTNDLLDEFEALMKKVADVYDRNEVNDNILENPEPGRLCCARYSKDMHFYRAVVRQVVDNNIDVYFLDFGNTETVPLFDVRILLPEFQELPALAMFCTLANAFPIEGIWIKKETDFFKTVVVGKPITLHVIAKQKDNYIVNVQCMNGSKQSDVLRLMVQAGCAEYWEVKQDPFLKIVSSQVHCSKKSKNTKKQSETVKQNNKVLIPKNTGHNKKLLNTHVVTKDNARIFPMWKSILSNKYGKMFCKTDRVECYKEYRFKPGSVFDVVCCHIISPGNFSCQIQNKLPKLNNMMEQLQNFYNTQKRPYESGKLACVVKYSTDGKWYRAVVLRHVSKTETDVMFVDYGNKERVLAKDLQDIHPNFLILERQAFRCCLNSVTESLIFDPYDWTAEICSDFRRFVSSSNGQLICSICALLFKTPNYLCYIVDLKTPFTSLRQFLFGSGHAQIYSFECARSLITSFSLCSFYYSSFNMEIGNEEEVYVTYIYSPTKFYCQLSRNGDERDKIFKNISEISQKTSHAIQINAHSLCIAKYLEDGFFYRALASPMESSDYWPVYFVDFGNKQLVAKEELVPIPNNASELMFTPMQAIKCYLSDLKDVEIPSEIKVWFEKNYLGKELKAVIVSKESDGQFGMELYDGELQINGKIKDLLKHIKCDLNPKDIKKDFKKCVGNKHMAYKIRLDIDETEIKSKEVGWKTEADKVSWNQNDKFHIKYGNKIVINQQKQGSRPAKFPSTLENAESVLENVLRQRYRSTYKESNTDTIDHPSVQSKIKDNRTGLHMLKLNSLGQEKSNKTKRKYANLPQVDIHINSKVWGYISYIANLSSFYVHRSEDENKIVQLAGELNGGMLIEPEIDAELEKDDVVLAEYEGDCCLYRALVREVIADMFFEVEFIDYGNTATVNSKKIYKIKKCFLNVPRLSIHCFLSKAKYLSSDKNWSTNMDAYFISQVINQPVMIEFLQQYDQQWEVDIICHGISMTDELMERGIHLGLQNILTLNFDRNTKQLPIIDSETDSNDPDKSESQTLCGTFKIRPAKIDCQNIKPGQLEIAEIGHISRNGNFYVKLIKDAQTILNLNVLVAQEVEKKCFITLEKIKEGLECLARSNETLKWYRSEVIKKYVKEECMLVLFVDVGKYEIVSLHDTHVLSEKIKCIPRNAVLCKWIWFGNLRGLSFERMMEEIKYCEIKILFLRYLESAFIWEVDILIDGILFLEYCHQISYQTKLERHSLPKIVNVSKSLDLPVRSNSIPWVQFQKNKHYPGFVTSAIDPSNFCIQLEDSFKTLRTLFKLLSDLPENLPTMPQECVVPGASCLIKNGPNEKWDRVEVSEVLKDSNTLILTFIDDGLSAPIPISDILKLKVIPEKLANLPRLTYPCSLFGVTPADGKHWNDEAKLKIQEFLGRQGLTFQYKQPHCGLKLEVDVFCERNNAADVLVASGCALYYKTASFGSTSCAELHLSNLHTICDPLQICSEKNSEAQFALNKNKKDPQNSIFQLKCVDCKNLKENSSKKLHRKKKSCQETFLHSSRRNYGNLHKSDEKLFNQCCGREQLNEMYSTNIPKADHKLLFGSKSAQIQIREEN